MTESPRQSITKFQATIIDLLDRYPGSGDINLADLMGQFDSLTIHNVGRAVAALQRRGMVDNDRKVLVPNWAIQHLRIA